MMNIVEMSMDVREMVKAVSVALTNHDTVSVMGSTMFDYINKRNIDAFMYCVNSGVYNNCTIKLDYDQEESELIVAFLNLAKVEQAVNINKSEEIKEDVKLDKGQWIEEVEGKSVIVDCACKCDHKGDLFSCTSCDKQNQLLFIDRKEDVKMVNATKEVKVENKSEGVVVEMENTNVEALRRKFEAKPDFNIARKFDSVVTEYGVKFSKFVSVVDGVEGSVALTVSNVALIKEGLSRHTWSKIVPGSVDFMYFRYTANEGTFTLELSASPINKASDSVKMNIDHITKEERKQQTTELIQAAMATRALENVIIENSAEINGKKDPNGIEEVTADYFAPMQDSMLPNAHLFDEAGGDISADRRKELEAKAPITGINCGLDLQKALINKVIKDSCGLNISTKVETTRMCFLELKKFMSGDAKAKEYKRVSIAWLFKILNPANFLILSDIPNEERLNDILTNGLIVSVVVGKRLAGKNEKGEDLYEDIWEERLFKYVASSASKQRQERYILTCYADRENIRKALVFWSDEFDFGKKSAVAKSESRVGTHLSTGVCVGGIAPYAKRGMLGADERFVEFYYMVLPDLTVADIKLMAGETPIGAPAGATVNEKGEPSEATGDYALVTPDGAGFHNEAAGKLIRKKMKNEYGFVQQGRLGKGVTHELKDADVAAHLAYRGISVDMSVPTVFVTESMWKFNVGINIMPFTILRTSVEMGEKAFMCYETWNALNISSEEGKKTLVALAEEEYNYLKLDKSCDPGLFAHRLGALAKWNADDSSIVEKEDILSDDEDEKTSLATSLSKMFYINAGLAMRSEYLIAKVNSLFQRKIADMARGKIMVNGSFCIMILDPGIWSGKPILKAGQVYVAGKTGKCLLARYPMVHMSEPQVMTAVDAPELSMFKGTNVIIFNVFDRVWENMQGADFDGDTCLVVFDDRVIALAITGLASPVQEKKEANKAILGWKSINEYFITNFNNMHPKEKGDVATIGKINNIVAALLSQAHANGTFLNAETVRRVAALAVIINDLIDAAKTGYNPPVDAWYFENFKLLPNQLAKPFQRPDGTFVNTWEVLTTDEDPESRYYRDLVSPLGRLANKTVPYFFKKFSVKGETPFKVADFAGIVQGATIGLVESQIKGIKSIYGARSSEIWNSTEFSKDEQNSLYDALVKETNERIRKVAATYDMYTTAVVCLELGRDTAFAFKCFEEGVIAVFEAMGGQRYVKIKNGMEVPAGTEIKTFDNVSYMVINMAPKTVQLDKFVDANVGKEVTLRLVGINRNDIPVNTVNDIKAAIADAGNIIRGGISNSGFRVALAGSTALGAITLERNFKASMEFAQGGYAEVLDVKPVLKKGEAFSPNSPIKYADLSIRYIADPNGGNTAQDSAPLGEAAIDSSFALPSMTGAASAPVSTPATDVPSVSESMSLEGINPEQALQMMGQLANMFGFKLTPATESKPVEEKKVEEAWPSYEYADEAYLASFEESIQAPAAPAPQPAMPNPNMNAHDALDALARANYEKARLETLAYIQSHLNK